MVMNILLLRAAAIFWAQESHRRECLPRLAREYHLLLVNSSCCHSIEGYCSSSLAAWSKTSRVAVSSREQPRMAA